MTSIECPCCGTHRLSPRSPRINEIRWVDCACSDRVMCIAHRLGGEHPTRPTDAVLASRGDHEHKIALEKFAAMALKFERWRTLESRIGSLLESNGCDCECEHHWEEHDDDCERCLACRIASVLEEKGGTP